MFTSSYGNRRSAACDQNCFLADLGLGLIAKNRVK